MVSETLHTTTAGGAQTSRLDRNRAANCMFIVVGRWARLLEIDATDEALSAKALREWRNSAMVYRLLSCGATRRFPFRLCFL
jgi:hypothetical protein